MKRINTITQAPSVKKAIETAVNMALSDPELREWFDNADTQDDEQITIIEWLYKDVKKLKT